MNIAEITNEDIEKHRGMVHKLVIKYFSQVRDPAIGYEDLLSEANIGLCKAYERFDSAKGFAFSTFAFTTISGYLQSFLDRRGSPIRYPANIVLLGNRIKKQELTGLEPEEIAEIVGESVEQVESAIQYLHRRTTISLDKPLRNKAGEIDPDTTHEALAMIEDDLSGVLTEEFICRLKPNQQTAARMRMEGYTYSEIGTFMGVSRTRVWQLLLKVGERYMNIYSREEKMGMTKGIKSEINMTKEQYLQERLSGKARTQIMKSVGGGSAAFYKLLKEWGIKEIDAEEREMELLAPAKPASEPPIEENPVTNQEQELASLQAALALWKNDAERKGEYIADLESELGKARENAENVHSRFMAVSEEQAAEISRLKEAMSGATVIANQAGARLSELEEENTRLKLELSNVGQASKVVAPMFGSSVSLHVPIITGTDPIRERLNVYHGLDALGETFESAGLDRERIMRELFSLLQTVVRFVATDLAELLPGQDVTEHVQRFFQEHNRQAYRQQQEAV
ncbi:sigma-70 family RNA polymerase sigma factor [Fontibacillus sp. BL9]|uniref:sigma-70 family RNA polymerase sigma factor n=1 Tax=Fontibacillus sp. BL9 TaxID=3389971 RepID=UPI00397D2859